MSVTYNKTNWVNEVTPLDADNMNNIENGIESLVNAVNEGGGGSTITIDDSLSNTSTNPVQNKVITLALDTKVDKIAGKGLSTNDYTDAEKAEVAKVSGKVDKVSGKGLSTNDYTDADKAEVAKVAGKLDKPTNIIEGLFGFNSAGFEIIKEITDAGVSVELNALDIPNNKALKEYVAAKIVNFLSKPTSNGIVGYMSEIGSFSYTLNTSMPENPLHTGILSAKAVYDYINSLDAREVSY